MLSILMLSVSLLASAERVVIPIPSEACVPSEFIPAPVTSIAVDPTNPDRALIVGDNSVWVKSAEGDCLSITNAGLEPLPPFFRPIHPNGVTIDPRDPNTAYLATEQGVYKSTNGGSSWEPRNIGIPFVLNEAKVFPVVADPVRANLLWIGNIGGVYKSANGGNFWFPSNAGLLIPSGGPGVSDFAFDPDDATIVYLATYRLFRSDDSGLLWKPIDNGLPSGRIGAVLVDRVDPDKDDEHKTLWAGTAHGIYRSLDTGTVWEYLGLQERVIFSIVQDPDDPSFFMLGTNRGAYVSTGGGGDWDLLAAPFENVGVFSVVLAPTDSSTIYVATQSGAYVSRDRGQSWTVLTLPGSSARLVPPR